MEVKRVDLILGLSFITFALAVYLIAPIQASGYTFKGISPAFFPRILTVMIMLFGGLLSIQGLRSRNDEQFVLGKKTMVRIIIVSVTAFAYLFIIPWLGYIISTMLFMMAMLMFYRAKKPQIIIISIVMPLLLHFTFTRIMYVVLPVGYLIELIIY